MKRLIALLTAFSLTAALLAGCGGGGNAGGTGGSGGSVQEEPAAEESRQAAEEAQQEAPAQDAGQEEAPAQDDAADNNIPTSNNAETTYIIMVQDADDAAPLSGVMVQFCSDTQCMVGRTDSNGAASFEVDPGNYTAHVLRVPEGYDATDQEIELTADNRTAVFSLHKSGTAGAEDSQTQAAADIVFDKDSDT